MNLAFLVNKAGGDRNKVANKTSAKPQQAEATDSTSICANQTCTCNWKPDKKASSEKRKPGLDSVWRGN